MDKKKKSIRIITIVTSIMTIMILAIIALSMFIPIINDKQIYESVISELDDKSCWMEICPGITSREKACAEVRAANYVQADTVDYRGDDSNGSMWWLWSIQGSIHRTSYSSIKWENGIVGEIDISLLFTNEELDYFIKLYGEPEVVLPLKIILPDSPPYWIIRLYYPEKGIELISRNYNDDGSIYPKDSIEGVVLFAPMKIEERLIKEFERSGINEYIREIREWKEYEKRYGDDSSAIK